MKEVTRIITAEITIIEKELTDGEAESIEKTKQDAVESVTKALKDAYNADDVKVVIKDFIRD